MINTVKNELNEIKELASLIHKMSTNVYLNKLSEISGIIVNALVGERKNLTAGNGGSAAEANHFAAELSGKFENMARRALPAASLNTNDSILTAVANDFGFEQVFSRQVAALGRPGDVFIGFSTSGNSKNIIEAVKQCKKADITTIGILGRDGGAAGNLCDFTLVVPSKRVPRIQEIHALIVHIICSSVDRYFTTGKYHLSQY